MRLALVAALALIIAMPAIAHEVRPARLDVTELNEGHYLVQWKVPALGDRALAIEPVFDIACSSEDDQKDGMAMGASVRTWSIQCPDGLAGATIKFRNLSTTMIDVLVHVSFLDGRHHTGLVRPDSPEFNIAARASESSLFRSYLAFGVEHILYGWDHLLFVLGLVLLVTNHKRLLWAITGFTIAHSITLALAVLGFVFVDGRPVEAIVALSIVFLGVENIRYRRTGIETLAIRKPWLVSSAIGLVHGLGFAGALSDYGLPAYAQYLSLIAFNLGVELGQLGFVASLLVAAFIVQQFSQKLLIPIQNAAVWLIGVSGAYWLVERTLAFYN